MHLTALDLPCLGAHDVEEPSVVGHHDEGAPPGCKVLRKPVDAFDV